MKRWWCPWSWCNDVDTSEAEQTMADLDALEPEIQELGQRLRDAARHNHFSDSIAATMRKVRET